MSGVFGNRNQTGFGGGSSTSTNSSQAPYGGIQNPNSNVQPQQNSFLGSIFGNSSSAQSNPPNNQSGSGGGFFNILGPKQPSEEILFSRRMVCSELKDKESFIRAIKTYTPSGVRRLLHCPNIEAVVATLTPGDGNDVKVKNAMADLLVLIKVGATQIDRDRELVECTDFMKNILQTLKQTQCFVHNGGSQICQSNSLIDFKNFVFEKNSKCNRGYMAPRIDLMLQKVSNLQNGPESTQLYGYIIDSMLRIIGEGFYQINQARAFIPINKMNDSRIKAARKAIENIIDRQTYERINIEQDSPDISQPLNNQPSVNQPREIEMVTFKSSQNSNPPSNSQNFGPNLTSGSPN